METALLIMLAGLLFVLAVQDFKYRAISWFIIPLLFVAFTVKAILIIDVRELLTYFGINFLIVFINLLGVSIMVSLKEKKITNILSSYIGIGDVLFFLVITVAFSPINFFVFFMGSVVLSSIIYGIMILIKKQKQVPFPLAGAMSLMLIVVSLIEYTNSSIYFFEDIFYGLY